MKENFIKASQNIIFALVVLAAFLSPLFFMPTTTEFFEFNKLAVLLIITIFGYFIWALRMLAEKKVVFTRTPLDVPILVLLAVTFIASFASTDQFISFFGSAGRVWPSFFTLATVSAFYFLTVSNLRTKKQAHFVLFTIIASTTLASVVAIISYFGIFLPFDFAKLRSFNTVGIINRLAILQAFVIPIALSLSVLEKDKATRITTTIATLIMAFSFVLINLIPAYIGLAVALTFLAVGTLRIKLDKNQQGSAAVVAVFIALFLVIRFVPQVAHGTLYSWIANKDPKQTEKQILDTPKEISMPSRTAWDVAAQTIGKKPLFGTGPGTYQFAYTQLKPRYMNATDNWAVRFDKSYSDFSEIITTEGLLGVLAFLLLAVSIVRLVWTLVSKSQHFNLYLPATTAIVGGIVANFFTVSSLSVNIVFFTALAAISVFAKATDESHVFEVTMELATLKNRFAWFPLGGPNDSIIKTDMGSKGSKSQILPGIFALCIIIISIIAIRFEYKSYRGEYFYRQSILARQSNDGARTVDFIQKALAANPSIDLYHRDLSSTALNAAINLSAKKDLTDNEKQVLGQLAQVAVDQGKVASGYQILPLRLPGISASNVTNWETLSFAYQALIGAVGGSDSHAVNTLGTAVSLDPENPVLHDRLGQLYERLNSIDLAQRKYEDATIVKGDYGVAHYHLARLLINKKGEVPKIVNELALAKRFLPANDPALPEIDKNLESYNKELRDLQEKAAQNAKNAQSASPAPGTSPTPSPSPSPSPSASPKTGGITTSPLPTPGL